MSVVKLLKEPEKIVALVKEIENHIKALKERDDDYKYADWKNAEIIEDCEESEDGMHLMKDGSRIAEWGDEYFVIQWTGYAPDDYHGYLYFRTQEPGKYVKVYYEM